MISYIVQKYNYCELVGLKKDKKPTAEIPNGSKFEEMDTGVTYRFDAESSKWITPKATKETKAADSDTPAETQTKKTTAKKQDTKSTKSE